MHYKCKQSVRVFQYLMEIFGSVLLIVDIVAAIIKIIASNTMVAVGTITTATTFATISAFCTHYAIGTTFTTITLITYQ